MNRKEFIQDFDYTIFVDYFTNIINQSPSHITHTNVIDLFNLIFRKYPTLNTNINFSTYETQTMGHCYVDEFDVKQYYKNIICLEFEAFYPTIYYVNFINNNIDYNENIFLLYSLMYYFRRYCKKNHPELYTVFRIHFHSFFGYIASRKYIKEHYPYNYFLKVCSIFQPYFLYADTDTIYLRNLNTRDVQDILTIEGINIPSSISHLKYFYIDGKKKHASYYRDELKNEYTFDIKGFRKDDEINKIKRNFLSDFRIEKIEKLLKNDNTSTKTSY